MEPERLLQTGAEFPVPVFLRGVLPVSRTFPVPPIEFPSIQLRALSKLDEAVERTLETAVRRLHLSARAQDRILRVARTVADLDHSPEVSAKHLAEAVRCRNLDRNDWN